MTPFWLGFLVGTGAWFGLSVVMSALVWSLCKISSECSRQEEAQAHD